MRVRAASCVVFAWFLACGSRAHAKEDIEFIAEHLPEVAMDNRYATLPVWTATTPSDGWTLLSVAASRALTARWTGSVFGFADLLSLSGSNDFRPLQTLFASATPIVRPVDARFDDLDGRMHHYGAGFAVGTGRWVGGVLFEQIELRSYGLNFVVLAGEAAGSRGRIDFDADYRYVTPFLGVQLVRERGNWTFSPHALIAWPLPRHALVGHIETAQFDLHGNAAESGIGKHFGDQAVTLGLDITYRPARLSFDVGTVLSQALLELHTHKGVDSNWVLSVRWQH